jgi:hypothetical protein
VVFDNFTNSNKTNNYLSPQLSVLPLFTNTNHMLTIKLFQAKITIVSKRETRSFASRNWNNADNGVKFHSRNKFMKKQQHYNEIRDILGFMTENQFMYKMSDTKCISHVNLSFCARNLLYRIFVTTINRSTGEGDVLNPCPETEIMLIMAWNSIQEINLWKNNNTIMKTWFNFNFSTHTEYKSINLKMHKFHQ